jgi:Competence-damaged protein
MPYHLNYHDALANDLPIGSGEIESAHRYLRSNAWNGQAPGGAVDHAVFGDFNGILHRRHDRGRSLARRRRRRIPAWRLRDVYEGTQTSALGLSADLLREKGAVNEEVVTQLARGALKHSPASVSLAVSGVLGPEEDEDGNPVGLVYFCCARSGRTSGRRERRIREEEAGAAFAAHDSARFFSTPRWSCSLASVTAWSSRQWLPQKHIQ